MNVSHPIDMTSPHFELHMSMLWVLSSEAKSLHAYPPADAYTF